MDLMFVRSMFGFFLNIAYVTKGLCLYSVGNNDMLKDIYR